LDLLRRPHRRLVLSKVFPNVDRPLGAELVMAIMTNLIDLEVIISGFLPQQNMFSLLPIRTKLIY